MAKKARKNGGRRMRHVGRRTNGSKKKEATRRWPKLIAASVVLLVLVVMVVSLGTGNQADSPARSAAIPSLRQRIGEVFDRYQVELHGSDDAFWLTGQEGFDEHIERVKAWTVRLRSLLKKHQHSSPLAMEIAQNFGNFYVSKFFRGISQTLGLAADEMIDSVGQLEVCTVDQASFQQYRQQLKSTLYYRKGWRAVMAAGVGLSDAWLAGLMFHEMGHALRHRVEDAASATAPPNSDEFIWEEVEMHEMEHQILNRESEGRVEEIYRAILSRPGVDSVQEALAATTLEDLKQFDQALGSENAGRIMAPIYSAQFITGLGCFYVNEREEGAKSKKIAFYRWLWRHLQ